MLNFPFLSLIPADHASCSCKSFPDTGDLLLSNLVIAPLLSCVSQRGCPRAPLSRVCLNAAPVSWPPQVIPLGQGECPRPRLSAWETCAGDVSHCTVLPSRNYYWNACACRQHTLASRISRACAQGSTNHTPLLEVPLGVITRSFAGESGYHERSL